MTESPKVSGPDIPGQAPLIVRARTLFASALLDGGSLNATIITGPTGNNLRDLRLLLAE